MALTDGQVATSTGDDALQRDFTFGHVALERIKSSTAEGVVERSIVVLIKRIKVLSESAGKELWLEVPSAKKIARRQGTHRLWDDRDA